MKLITSADTDCESKRASNSHVFGCNLVTSYQHSTLLYTIVVYTACDASQLHLHPSVVSSPACESAQSMVLWHMKGVLAGHLAGEAEPKKTQYNFILQNTSKILQKTSKISDSKSVSFRRISVLFGFFSALSWQTECGHHGQRSKLGHSRCSRFLQAQSLSSNCALNRIQ